MIATVIRVLVMAKFKVPSCKGGPAVLAGWKEVFSSPFLTQKSATFKAFGKKICSGG